MQMKFVRNEDNSITNSTINMKVKSKFEYLFDTLETSNEVHIIKTRQSNFLSLKQIENIFDIKKFARIDRVNICNLFRFRAGTQFVFNHLKLIYRCPTIIKQLLASEFIDEDQLNVILELIDSENCWDDSLLDYIVQNPNCYENKTKLVSSIVDIIDL